MLSYWQSVEKRAFLAQGPKRIVAVLNILCRDAQIDE